MTPAPSNIYDQLRRDEGVRPLPYEDTTGHLTIGVGHNLEFPISTRAIDQILSDDLASRHEALLKLPWYEALSLVRQAVLLNMAFPLGISGLLGFHDMIRCLVAGDYDGAAREILNSTFHRQVGARAERLALQMSTDQWV